MHAPKREARECLLYVGMRSGMIREKRKVHRELGELFSSYDLPYRLRII